MKKINLWSIDQDETGAQTAHEVSGLDNTETEERLEALFVKSPELLMEGLSLVGRQVPTAGGPLDLLGIDRDGRAVLFELKRGVLTRDAVAQILDYGSDLAERGLDNFARLVEKHSGSRGVKSIDDFMDWYDQEFPDRDDPLEEAPRMVLVGLGVDDRVRRIVNFLAGAGVDLQLLTFHAFEVGGKLLLAKQVETEQPKGGEAQTKTQTKEGNQRILWQRAEQFGVRQLLEEVADFVDARMLAYRWPAKTAYSFSLQERTSEGKPSLRSYVTIYVNDKKPGSLLLSLAPRARDVAGEHLRRFVDQVSSARFSNKSYHSLEAELTEKTWPEARDALDELLGGIVEGWKAKRSREEEAAPIED